MNLLWTTARVLLSAILVALPAALSAAAIETQGIYGSDDRKEVCNESDVALRELAEGTLAKVPQSMLKENQNGDLGLKPTAFGKKHQLCKSEPFWDQPIVADCSGFLIGDDLMVTAGHCISKASCGREYWIFNYQVSADGKFPETVSKQNAYVCKEVIARTQTATIDYALFRLDRKVQGGRALKLRQGAAPQVGDGMFVIGYPMGLPAKIAGNAKVRKWGIQKRYFVTNLDTYGGNSGSPVFNTRTNEVEGILVRGDEDFVSDGFCKVSKRCEDSRCDGEEVTNITYIQDLIDKTDAN